MANLFDHLEPDYKPPKDEAEKANLFDHLEPKTTAGGLARTFIASGIDNTGSMLQGGLEVGAKALNSALGTEKYAGFNPLKSYADSIREGMTPGDKIAAADAVQGNVLDPSSWKGSNSAGGYAHSFAQGLGSIIPTAATGLIAGLATRGRSLNLAPAMAVQGGLTTGGAAAGDVREDIGKLDDAALAAKSPAYKALIDGGMSAADARAKISNESAQLSGLGSGALGALGGAFNARILEDFVAKKGIPALLGEKLAGRPLARYAAGATVGKVAEGGQEVAEKVGQNIGQNIGMGKAWDDDSFRDTFGDFVGGAMVGHVTGGVGGLMSKPHIVAPTGETIDPNAGPISRAAATAITSGVAQGKADQASAQAAQEQATADEAAAKQQQDAEAKAFTGKPQFSDPVKWFDSLNGAGQTTLIQTLDGEERQTALELMATARDPRTSDPIREKAAGMLHELAQTKNFPGAVAPDALPTGKPTPAQMDQINADSLQVQPTATDAQDDNSDSVTRGQDAIAAWSARSPALTLQDAQEMQRRAADDGRADMVVVPHASGQGYTMVPASWTTQAGKNYTSGIQGEGNGTLAAPDTTTELSTKVAPGAIEGEYIQGRQTDRQYFPFKNEQQAEARAMAATKQFGEEYGVEPHPSVKGAFAVVPSSKVIPQSSTEVNTSSAGIQAQAQAFKRLPQKQQEQLFTQTSIGQELAQQSEQSRVSGETSVQPILNKAETQKLSSESKTDATQSATSAPAQLTNTEAVAKTVKQSPTKKGVVKSPEKAPTEMSLDEFKATPFQIRVGDTMRDVDGTDYQVTGKVPGGLSAKRTVSQDGGVLQESTRIFRWKDDELPAARLRAMQPSPTESAAVPNAGRGASENTAVQPVPNRQEKEQSLVQLKEPNVSMDQSGRGAVQDERAPSDQAVAPERTDAAPRSDAGQSAAGVKQPDVAAGVKPNGGTDLAGTTEPAGVGAGVNPLAKVPKLFVMKHEVETRAYDTETDKYEAIKAPAQEALDANQRDIETFEALKKCVGAS